jgi:glycyl-tRNA synthetase beta chain
VLALAERLDTLAGGFVAGLKPTGNKDPFALRRNALGLARTLIEGGLDLDLGALFALAVAQARDSVLLQAARRQDEATRSAQADGVAVQAVQTTSAAGVDTEALVRELRSFVYERLRGYYADQGIGAAVFDAVAELQPASLLDFDRRLRAIGVFAKLPEAQALAAANKRIRNILRKHEGAIPAVIDQALMSEPAETALFDALNGALGDTDPLLAERDYVGVLTRLAELRPSVDAYFEGVMVMAEDMAVRGNRLALLKRLADRFATVAAIETLAA